jgi:hypothetical protein
MAWIVILDLKCPLIHLTGLLGNESISLFLTPNPNRVTPWTFFDYRLDPGKDVSLISATS